MADTSPNRDPPASCTGMCWEKGRQRSYLARLVGRERGLEAQDNSRRNEAKPGREEQRENTCDVIWKVMQ
ncbi:MAG TPA: hypothetical protein VFV38_13605 [Ktedonobacteraceae bacterium]|nr:hypothetical protein [Ktedonobacteraceae bacterium]